MDSTYQQAGKIMGLASGYWASCALHTAVRTGLTNRLSKEKATLDDLFQKLSLDKRALGMLLTAMVTLGFFTISKGKYGLAPWCEDYFDEKNPKDMTMAVLHMADMVESWSKMSQSLKNGKPIPRQKDFQDKRQEHFYKAMRALARQSAKGLAEKLNLKPHQTVLDLAGGPGVYGLTFCEEIKGLSAVVFDLENARPFFEQEAKLYENRNNVTFKKGDYLKDSLEGPYDVVWISQVLHGESKEQSGEIISKVADSLVPGGVVWIQEFVVDPKGKGHPFGALFALNMLINTEAGGSYTKEEIFDFMTKAGLIEQTYVGPITKDNPGCLLRAVKPA